MNKKFVVILLTGLALGLNGCSSLSQFSKRMSADITSKPAQITCWSGGKLILKEITKGKVISESNSDGYQFTSSDGTLTEVSGDCVITYN